MVNTPVHEEHDASVLRAAEEATEALAKAEQSEREQVIFELRTSRGHDRLAPCVDDRIAERRERERRGVVGGAAVTAMPGGASFGASRASAALNDPLRSDPQMLTTFT